MIIEKFTTAIMAMFNSIANAMFSRNSEAVIQLEVDRATERVSGARRGLEMQRGLVEGFVRKENDLTAEVARLKAQMKSFLASGNREAAGEIALKLNEALKDLEQAKANRALHEESYNNFLLKVQQATKDVLKLQEKAQKMVAELKMSNAEVEMARVAEALDTNLSSTANLTTNLGRIESVIQGQIDSNRGKVRVAADLSSRGVEEIKARQQAEKFEAEDLLRQFESEMGLVTPESTPVKPVTDRAVGTSTTQS